jgi:protein-S-isoprenylcysteine O-methyltransferase Ste14
MRDHAGVFVPPPLLFALPLLGAVILHSRRPWQIAEGGSTILVLGGFAAIGGAIALVFASIASFRKAETTILPAGRPTTAIVERGPYRLTRNPMYLSMAIAYLGASMALNNFWAIVFLPAILVVVDVFVIRREERYLTSKFGQTYRDYCSRVRRWL